MKIEVYRRPDGSLWADFQQPPRPDRVVVKTYEAGTRAELESLARNPCALAPERVSALARRALGEVIAASKPKERPVDARFTDVIVGERGFLGRFKWLVTGR